MKRWREVEPGIIAGLNAWTCGERGKLRKLLRSMVTHRLKLCGNGYADSMRSGLSAGTSWRLIGPNDAMGFQFGLVEAIGRAQAWLVTDEQITELENLTLGQERDNVKQWHWSSPV